MMRRCLAAAAALTMLFCAVACAETLTYAVYPYLPDVGYYQEIIERRWAEVEPDIRLVRAEWDCYTDGAPEGIDVIMFDAVMLDALTGAGWIRPVDPGAVRDPGDIFPFALEGLTVDGSLYGIPVFLCGNFLIYDRDCEALAAAERLTDLGDMPGLLVVNSENPVNRPQYVIEVLADEQGVADPAVTGGEDDAMRVIDRLAVDGHKRDDDALVTAAYDAGEGQGYIGFSESMRLLKNRTDKTDIRTISFGGGPDVRRLYTDAVAVTAGVDGERYEKCLKLMNIIADAGTLTELSVRDGAPQYLLPARKSPYRPLSEAFPLYTRLEELAGAEDNHVIRTP